MEHILVPVDFSAESEKALKIAANEALLKNAHVTLLHVVETVSPQDLEVYPTIVNNDDSGREIEAKNRLQEIGDKFFSGVPFEIMIRRSFGSAYNEIASIESKIPVSLIVISTHTRTFFEKLFLESTSSKIINSSKCPVLVVPV